MSKNQKINCDVVSCKYQNTDKNVCELEEIKVSCICDNDDCTDCTETICDSFETAVDDE